MGGRQRPPSQQYGPRRQSPDWAAHRDAGEGLHRHDAQARIERVLNGGLAATASPGAPRDTDAGGPLVLNVKPSRDTSKSLPSLKSAGAAPSTSDIDAIDRFANQLERSAAALKAETDAYGKSSVEKAKAINLAKAEEIAKQNNVTLTQQQIDRINAASTATANFKDRLADLEQRTRLNGEAMKFFGDSAATALGSMIFDGAKASDVLKNLVRQLGNSALQGLLTGSGSLAGLFGTAAPASAGSGAVGGLFGMLAKGIGFADGGLIQGPGTGRSDSILARVSHGEFVVNAGATAKHRAILEAINSGRLPGFADGGPVSPVPSMPNVSGTAPAQPVINIAPNITVQGGGGDPRQNDDLAKRISKEVENVARKVVCSEIQLQQKPGGMLNNVRN